MENVKDDLISISQLSRKLKISIIWLKAQVDKDVLPCIDADGKLLFNLQAVRNKLAELAAKGATDE